MDAMMQSAVIELIQKDAVVNPANKPRYLRLIFDLLESSSNTVVYEAAITLANLTINPAAIKGTLLEGWGLMVAAASKFIDLAIKESDNNVKLIALDKVNDLHHEHEGVLEDLVMEILRVLSSPDIDVRNKALEIAMNMVTSRNVEEVIGLLKKDLIKTVEQDYEKVFRSCPSADVEQRVPPVTDQCDSQLRNSLFGSRGQWHPRTNGIHRGIQ
jgi:coatomer subunit beta